ncbi:hypothetical protein [Nocardia huaxiensis]|uniref:hypothetical protein n=1 Tax=Nocardia huaxiensis TaxID=2755382 RepID=UPI001C669679|nr:hypothetical protein [Nocardia huaxiensis]
MIVALIVPAGTPALRLSDLATVQKEREVLLIDARSYFMAHPRIREGGVTWEL